MNKLITTFVTGLVMMFTTHLYTQPSFSISPSNIDAGVGEQITVDIVVSDFTDILSIQYSMNWDPLILDFVSVGNLSTDLPGLSVANFGTNPMNVDIGNMTVSWFDPNVTGVSVSDNTILYSLTFEVLSATGTEIVFSGSPLFIEIVDSNGNDIGFNTTNGTVNGGPGGGNMPEMTISANDVSGLPNETVCVDVSVEDFMTIVSMDFSMNFDPTIVQFNEFDNLNLSDLDIGDFDSSDAANGNLSLSWMDTQNTNGTTLGDGAVIFQACFTIIGNPGESSDFDFSNSPVLISVTNGAGEPVTLNANNGSITVDTPPPPADLTVAANDLNVDNGSTACLDISVTDFDNIQSFEWSMNFDPSVLSFDQFDNFNLSDLTLGDFDSSDAGNGNLTVSWMSAGSGVTVTDGTVIFQACFNVIGDPGTSSDFEFTGNPLPINVLDGDNATVNLVANNGSVTVNAPTGNELILTASDLSANNGDQVCLDVTVENFDNILSFQWSMNFDPTVLEFVEFANLNLQDLTNGNFGTSGAANGDLTVSWFDNTNVSGVTIPDGTVIFQVCFNVIGSGGSSSGFDFSGTPTIIEVTDGDGNNVGLIGNNGSVSVNGGGGGSDDFTVSASDVTANNGDQVCLDVTVENFDNILSFQWSMNFDPTVLEFVEFTNLNLQDLTNGNFGTSGAANGDLTVSWFDNTNVSGVTVPDGTVIFQVCFNVIGSGGSSSNFDFTGTPTIIEVTDGDGNTVDMFSNSGSVNVNGGGGGSDDFIVSASDVTANNGDQVCLDVTVENFDNILSFQWSMNFDPSVLEFVEFANLNLQDLTNGNFGTSGAANGDLTVSWFDNTNVSGVTVPDGTVIFQACFNVIGSGGSSSNFDFTGTPTIIEVTDGDGNTVDMSSNSGSVNVNGGGGGSDDFTVSASDVTANNGDQVCLDVTVENFDNILSFQWSMNFDPSVLEFVEFANLNLQDLTNGNFGTSDAGNGNLTISWFDNTNVSGVTVPDGTVIFQACFNVIGSGGSSSDFDFTGNPTIIEVTDGDGNTVDMFSNSGSVNVNGGGGGTGDFTVSASDVTANNGDQVCLDVTVENFDNILSFQWSMNFDPSVLEFVEFANLNLQDLTNGNFGTSDAGNGNLTISWFDNTNVSGVTVPDGTVIFQACFNVIGSGGSSSDFDFTGNPTIIEVTDGDGNTVDMFSNSGSVNVNGGGGGTGDFTVSASDVTANNGDQVCLDVTVENFDNILSFQWSMNFDPSVLSFTGIQNLNLQDLTNGNFGTSDSGNGNLTVSWFDNTNVSGVTVPDGTVIFQVCFDVIGSGGSSSDFDFTGNPTIIEVTDGDGNTVDMFSNSGSVNVNGGGGGTVDFTVSANDVTANNGDQVCLDVTVDNFDNILSFQWSMNFDPSVLSFTGVQNLNLQDLTNGNIGTSGASNGDLTISWFDNTNVSGVTVPDGTVIFQVCFDVIGSGGSSSDFDFTGSPTIIEVTDGDGNTVDMFSNSGSVTVNGGGGGSDDFTVIASDETAMTGENVCLEVSVEGFNNILSYQWSMNFDPTILEFTGFQNLNLQDLTNGNFGTSGAADGNLTVSWFDNTNVSGVTVPDGTVIFEVCFDAIGGGTSDFDFSGNPTIIEITDGDGNTVDFNSNSGSVTVEGPPPPMGFNVIASDINAVPSGDMFCLDVSVTGFDDILSMQYSMNFDPNAWQFESITGLNLQDLADGSFGDTEVDMGNITFSWFDNTNASGVTVPDGTVIYQVCFTAIGPNDCNTTTQLIFSGDPTIIEVTNGNSELVEFNSDPGNVVIGNTCADPVQFDFADVDGFPGSQICQCIDVANFIDVVSFQFSVCYDETVLDFTGVQNFNSSLGGFGPSNVNTNNLTFSWFDDQLEGNTLADGECLVEICFDVIGDPNDVGCIEVCETPTIIEVSNGSGQTVAADTNQGCVTVENNCEGTISLTMEVVNNVSPCNGDDNAQIDITDAGGQGAGSNNYEWTNGSGQVVSNNQDLVGVGAGTYTLNITGCGGMETFSKTYIIEEPNPINISVANTTNVACNGDSSGSINLNVSGGDNNFSYNWNNPAASGPNPSNLPAGNYVVSITDGAGCMVVSEIIQITQPSQALTASGTSFDAACFGEPSGSIQINANGGTPGYNYSITPNNGSIVLTNNVYSNLLPGNYIINVVDANGCNTSFNDIVGSPNQIVVTENSLVEDTDNCNGSVDISVSGGSGLFQYNWSGPSGTFNTQDISNLCGGEYCVTVTDNTGNCMVTQCFDVVKPLEVTLVEQTNACFNSCDGSATISISGGVQPYDIDWGNNQNEETVTELCAGTFTVTVSTADGQSMSLEVVIDSPAAPLEVVNVVENHPSSDISCDGSISFSVAGGYGGYSFTWSPFISSQDNLCEGTYNLTVTDLNGCTAVQTFVLDFVPGDLICNVSGVDADCFDSENGSLTVSPEGGLPPYNVTVQPGDLSCTINNLGGTCTFDGLSPNVYLVTVTDSSDPQKECTTTFEVGSPPEIIVDVNKVTDVSDLGLGKIDIETSGGVPGYDYEWSNGFGAQNPTNLEEGCYDLTITDNAGCVKLFNDIACVVELEVENVNISQPPCPEDAVGSIDITPANGNNQPFTYSWTDENGEEVGTSEDLLNVPTGTYTVVVTDTCDASFEVTYELTAQSNLVIDVASLNQFNGFDVACNGESTGIAQASIIDGLAPFSTLWSNGETGLIIDDVPAGEYSVTITDGANCTVSQTLTLTEPDPLEATFEIDSISCFGSTDGAVEVNVTGGYAAVAYDYDWNVAASSQNGSQAFNLGAGNLVVSVMDDNGCEGTFNTIMVEPDELVLTGISAPVTESLLGSAAVIESGGTPPYTYFWGNELPPVNPQPNLERGQYPVIVTDSRGCQETITITVEFEGFCLDVRNTISPNGDGLNENFLILCLGNYRDTRLQIFNRWGQLVFEMDDYDDSWVGTYQRGGDVPEGTYFFVFDYVEIATGEAGQRRGHITVIRD